MKKALIISFTVVLAMLITGCETPSQSATKRPDTMGSATAMLTGHRPAKKKKADDDTKKIIGLYGTIALMGGTYYYYETKRKRT